MDSCWCKQLLYKQQGSMPYNICKHLRRAKLFFHNIHYWPRPQCVFIMKEVSVWLHSWYQLNSPSRIIKTNNKKQKHTNVQLGNIHMHFIGDNIDYDRYIKMIRRAWQSHLRSKTWPCMSIKQLYLHFMLALFHIKNMTWYIVACELILFPISYPVRHNLSMV